MKLSRVITLVLAVMFAATAVFAQENVKTDKKKKNVPVLVFKTTSHDFGTIEQGADGTFNFEYTNDSKTPLIVTDVKSSCGCTIPNWSKEPLQKKGKASIVVKYDTNRLGSFSKTITVYSTSENSPVTLTIRGNVVKKSEQTGGSGK